MDTGSLAGAICTLGDAVGLAGEGACGFGPGSAAKACPTFMLSDRIQTFNACFILRW